LIVVQVLVMVLFVVVCQGALAQRQSIVLGNQADPHHGGIYLKIALKYQPFAGALGYMAYYTVQ
jgi:hypothetical protein